MNLTASASFKLPEDFLKRISRLEQKTDEIIPKVLEAGGEVVLEKVRGNLREVLSPDATGELEGALGLSPARMDRDGNFNVKVGFDEPRRDGSSNAMVANIIEYGKHGQPPRPFLQPAKSASRAPCIEAMKRKLDNELGSI